MAERSRVRRQRRAVCAIFAPVRTAFLVALCVLHCVTAHASAADESEALIKEGLELRRAGDDEAALPRFQSAYRKQASPRTAGQLGLCELALGLFTDSEQHLADALKAPADPWVTKNRSALEDSLRNAKLKVGRIGLSGQPAGAEVLVNGGPVGTLPLREPVRVSEGTVELTVRAPGFKPESRSVIVAGGHFQKVTIQLERASVAVPESVASRAGRPDESAYAPAAVPATDAGFRWRPALKWIAWGAAAGAGVVGVVSTLQNRSKVADFDKGCSSAPTGAFALPDSRRTDAECIALKSDYQSASTRAIGGFVAAGALAVGGLVLLLTEPKPTRQQTSLSWQCAPSWGGALCGGRF